MAILVGASLSAAVLSGVPAALAKPTAHHPLGRVRTQRARPGRWQPRVHLAKSMPLHYSFEGESNFRDGQAIFRYYRPRPGQRLDPAILRSLLEDQDSERWIRNLNGLRALAEHVALQPPKTPGEQSGLATAALLRRIRWGVLTDEGRATFLTRLFRRETACQLLPDFFERYRAPHVQTDLPSWQVLAEPDKLAKVVYGNLNTAGRKRYKQIMQEVFPLHRTPNAPPELDETLFLEGATTFELRHEDKTTDQQRVSRLVRWMKRSISSTVRPHRHISWKPDLDALRAGRKEFLSFLQRIDLLSFSQRLEKQSIGALYGAYGENFKPYSASKLKEIDRSLVERSYSLLLGSKLHGVGLRTYRDGSIGLEVRAVNDADQLAWYVRLIASAIGRGRIGSLRYDTHPIEFQRVGAAAALGQALSLHRKLFGLALGPVDAQAIDRQLARAGLDERLSYPLQDWTHQAFVPRAKRLLIAHAQGSFVGTLARLLSEHEHGTLDDAELRTGAIQAVWHFAQKTRLSEDLERSLTAPLATRFKSHLGSPPLLRPTPDSTGHGPLDANPEALR